MQGGQWRGGRQRLIVVVTVVCSPLIVPLVFFFFFPLLCLFCLCYFCFRPTLSFHRRRQQETEGEASASLTKAVPVAEGRLLQKYLEDQLCLVGELGFLFEFGDDERRSDVGDANDYPQKRYEQVGNGDSRRVQSSDCDGARVSEVKKDNSDKGQTSGQ
ncbi:unnamed protein product [Victoria cruziana]